jgi:hypothetical protein
VTAAAPGATKTPRRAPLLRRAGTACLVVGGVLIAVTWVAVLAFSEEVQILARRHDPADEAAARSARDPRDDVAEIYGIPEGRPVRVVFPEATHRIDPPEAPGRVLLFVDRAHGESPLLARTLAATGSAGGALLLAAGAALLLGARRPRTADPAPRG